VPDKIVSKSYPFHVKDKIETALQQWLNQNVKSYQIISIETDELNATKTIRIQFDNPFEARRFDKLRIPVDLFRWKWEKRLDK
jgi:hypothetical protein